MARGALGKTPACRVFAQASGKRKPQGSARDQSSRRSAAMNRPRECCGFAIRFYGLVYMALWPLSTPDEGGRLFGAAYLCGERAFALFDALCDAPHPLRLSPALHALGIISALIVIVHFALRALRRRRRAYAEAVAVDAAILAARIPALREASPPQRPQRSQRPVKPRPQFGLRVPQ
jgi:hypothetical protein